MLTLEQAHAILDHIVSQTRLTREEHSLAGQAVQMLYDGAKENQENRQAANVVPFPTPAHAPDMLEMKAD